MEVFLFNGQPSCCFELIQVAILSCLHRQLSVLALLAFLCRRRSKHISEVFVENLLCTTPLPATNSKHVPTPQHHWLPFFTGTRDDTTVLSSRFCSQPCLKSYPGGKSPDFASPKPSLSAEKFYTLFNKRSQRMKNESLSVQFFFCHRQFKVKVRSEASGSRSRLTALLSGSLCVPSCPER